MKILFIYSLDGILPSAKPLRSWSAMQFGISSISSLLKAHGHQTRLSVLASTYLTEGKNQLATEIERFDPGLICFTAVFTQYQFIEEMARYVKSQWPDRYLIIGGVHATLQPEEVISAPFDALCIGEGEYPTLELCRQLESQQRPHGIANLWIKGMDGSVEKNRPGEFIQDLDQLPFPDYALWEPWIEERADDELVILAGRGCPYDCTYCSNHALRKVASGQYVRMRSPDNVLAEVDFLYKKYPHRRFFFELETLDCYKSWTTELCDKLADFNASVPEPLSFGSNYRINPKTIDEIIFSALERAHFTTINIGLESGSERVRRDVLKRHYTNDDFLKTVSLARAHGLAIFLYNMIGLPGETLAEHQETVQLNRLVQPEGHFTGIFFPYPGTELYSICVEQGLLHKGSSSPLERKQPAITLPQFTKAQISSAYIWFHYHVYRGYKPIRQLLLHVALIKINSVPILDYLFKRTVQPLVSLIFKNTFTRKTV